MWLHSLKVAQLLRSAACLHTNQSQSYLNHLVLLSQSRSKERGLKSRGGKVDEVSVLSHILVFNLMKFYLLIVIIVFRQRNGLPTSRGSIPGRNKRPLIS